MVVSADLRAAVQDGADGGAEGVAEAAAEEALPSPDYTGDPERAVHDGEPRREGGEDGDGVLLACLLNQHVTSASRPPRGCTELRLRWR